MDPSKVKAWAHPGLHPHPQGDPQDVCTVRVMHGAECGTDHKFVCGKLKIRNRRNVRAAGVKLSKRIDVPKLQRLVQ